MLGTFLFFVFAGCGTVGPAQEPAPEVSETDTGTPWTETVAEEIELSEEELAVYAAFAEAECDYDDKCDDPWWDADKTTCEENIYELLIAQAYYGCDVVLAQLTECADKLASRSICARERLNYPLACWDVCEDVLCD